MMNTERNNSQGEWEQLRDDYFGDRPILIAANRAPVTFTQTETGEFEFTRGAGGLVTALSALAQYLPATWIACARTAADVAWGQGHVPLAYGHEIEVRFIDPSVEAYDGYYNQIANPLLWFVQHSMWDLPL
ncbi:MAG: trehalose-6-phosphate synthase, partial [Anaerolineales bacterium]|nr:trehalose-6-phosphate synthase [Anaerolineales bacterium]